MSGAGESVLFVVVSRPGEGDLVAIIAGCRVFLVIGEELSIRCPCHGVESLVVSGSRSERKMRVGAEVCA